MKRIDVDELKKAFRRRAIETGVDPVEGSTVYQAANATAEANKRVKNKANGTWWQHAVLWYDDGEVSESIDRAVEWFAILWVLNLCFRLEVEDVRRAATSLALVQHLIGWTKADAARIDGDNFDAPPVIPLRVLNSKRGEPLVWTKQWRRGEEVWVKTATG